MLLKTAAPASFDVAKQELVSLLGNPQYSQEALTAEKMAQSATFAAVLIAGYRALYRSGLLLEVFEEKEKKAFALKLLKVELTRVLVFVVFLLLSN